MGRNRRPVEARVLDGTYQASRHGPLPDVTDLASPPPKCPPDLTGEARKVWDELLPLVATFARERDGFLLADLCRWRAELNRVRAKLAKTKPGDKGYTQLLVSAGICQDKMDKIASRFGMTPSDRAKLRADMTEPVRSRIPSRPKTALDAAGGPK